jgi:hypothetical protein
VQVNPDAFSSGQILCKLWLAEELEKVIAAEAVPEPLTVAALGGWYGMMNLMVLHCQPIGYMILALEMVDGEIMNFNIIPTKMR